jgi:type II secretory ATPase GspE/PulE/Tfp pilus assembly ATPase PilB-like protein
MLRQDPDVIMVGEIRDKETAEIAVQAALVGRLLLSTLHTNDSTGSVPRLLDIGVEPYLLSSSLTLGSPNGSSAGSARTAAKA